MPSKNITSTTFPYRQICTNCNRPKKPSSFLKAGGIAALHCDACKSFNNSIKNWNRRSTPITKKLYYELVEGQRHRCAICDELFSDWNFVRSKRLAADHCHTCGQLRGLLCTNCNLALGLFRDNKLSLQKAIDYLLKHDERRVSAKKLKCPPGISGKPAKYGWIRTRGLVFGKIGR